jgi:dTDP-4-dehydrorhamnose reductase
MLGVDVSDVLVAAGHEVVALGREQLDITDPRATHDVAEGMDVVLNCAAYTAVDAAEDDEATAFMVNAVGPANLARAARRAGARMVQISTDYVFGGDADEPYPTGAPIAPRTAYGRTKAAGEWAVRAEQPDHLVVRTAWLYGAHGACFPRTIARIAAERGGVDVIEDQVGQPTWTRDLADFAVRLVEAGAASGTYHGTAAGRTSWHGFAREVVASAGMDPGVVRATTSAEFVRPAPRPAFSVLAQDDGTVGSIGHWRDRWSVAASSVLEG